MERGERLVKVGKCHQLGWTKGGMSAVCDARSKQCVCTSGAVTTKRVPTLHLSPLDRWETSVAPLRIQHNRLSITSSSSLHVFIGGTAQTLFSAVIISTSSRNQLIY